jgi:hypothetical protein
MLESQDSGESSALVEKRRGFKAQQAILNAYIINH